MRLLTLAVLLFLAVGCTPAFQPKEGSAPGVTVTVSGTTITVDAAPALTRLFVRVPSNTLASPADVCSDVDGAVECVAHDVTSLRFELSGPLELDPSKPLGVACRDECYTVFPPH